MGYKFFCFSNIYPFGDFKEGSERSLLISSPDRRIIDSIERAALSKMKSSDAFFIGNHQFNISYVSKPFRVDLQGYQIIVRSATPIVMRIPKTRFKEYGIEPKVDYDYVFWRETIPLEAFVKQLADNMVKKVTKFLYGDHVSSKMLQLRTGELTLPEITDYQFIRSIAKPITVRQGRQTIIGSIWELRFLPRGPAERQALEISLDSGLGERNSLGFGFANPINLSYSNL
jgi:CRISPR-associated endoribonuclease Cas6